MLEEVFLTEFTAVFMTSRETPTQRNGYTLFMFQPERQATGALARRRARHGVDRAVEIAVRRH
jgi:hypothetical protein